jgi:hypothetical protein
MNSPHRAPGRRSGKPGTHHRDTPALSENSSTSRQTLWIPGFLGDRRSIVNVGFLRRGANAIATPPTRRGFVLLDARHPCRSTISRRKGLNFDDKN